MKSKFTVLSAEAYARQAHEQAVAARRNDRKAPRDRAMVAVGGSVFTGGRCFSSRSNRIFKLI